MTYYIKAYNIIKLLFEPSWTKYIFLLIITSFEEHVMTYRHSETFRTFVQEKHSKHSENISISNIYLDFLRSTLYGGLLNIQNKLRMDNCYLSYNYLLSNVLGVLSPFPSKEGVGSQKVKKNVLIIIKGLSYFNDTFQSY